MKGGKEERETEVSMRSMSNFPAHLLHTIGWDAEARDFGGVVGQLRDHLIKRPVLAHQIVKTRLDGQRPKDMM